MTQKSKSWLFYVLLLIIFILLGYWLVREGSSFQTEMLTDNIRQVSDNTKGGNDWGLFMQSIRQNIAEPFAILLLQLIAILITVRIFGFLFIKIGQPTVIGEILAGIVLGPSILGYFYPNFFEFLFPANSMGTLETLSQLGLIFFMFIIGMELEWDQLKKKLNETFVISHASIIVPFFFGMLLSYFVYEEYAKGHASFLSFSLFIGISMSITAFPVLARIVQEKGLTKTHLGILAIASAANNDVTAWCLLAVVIAIAKTGTVASALYTIGFSILYVLMMFFVIKPFLRKLSAIYQNKETINKGIVAFLFLILILSSAATQIIGIHALFGAFLAGVIIPSNLNFRKIVTEKIEDITLILLLPLFFVFTGLRTEIGLLNTPELWMWCAVFIIVGVAGKFLGTAAAAKTAGESWRDSLSLGALMNARGLMELIVLNIGYEMGILPPTIFVILVIMALVTTVMTTPALSLINRIFPEKEVSSRKKKFKLLLSFGRPESGPQLLSVVKAVFGNDTENSIVTALHMTVGTDVNPIHADIFSEEGFVPILNESEKIHLPIETAYRVTDDVGKGIVDFANEGNYDFLLVGAGISHIQKDLFNNKDAAEGKSWWRRFLRRINKQQQIFYPGNFLKDKTKQLIEHSQTSVGVFINKDFSAVSSLLILLDRESDMNLLKYARSILLNNPTAKVTILDTNGLMTQVPEVIKRIRPFSDQFAQRIALLHKRRLSDELFTTHDFMLIGYDAWNVSSEKDKEIMQEIPSTLIIHEKLRVKNEE